MFISTLPMTICSYVLIHLFALGCVTSSLSAPLAPNTPPEANSSDVFQPEDSVQDLQTTPVLSAAKEDDEYDFELEEWIIGPFPVEYMSKDEEWLAASLETLFSIDHGPIDGYVGQKLNSEKDIKFKGKNNVGVYQFTGKKSKENCDTSPQTTQTSYEVASLYKVGLYHGLGSVNGHLVIVIDKVKGKSPMLTEEWMTALDSRRLEMMEDIGGAVRELIIHLAMIEGIFLTMMYMKDEGNIYVVFNNDRTLKRVRLIDFGPRGIIVIKPDAAPPPPPLSLLQS
ncbi:hypothetical protein FB446DRAFT_793170 [Lentinula raphanica]|nr:hypothetical protein FB446DRAFT_793170 [Lentinula raphanica]